MRIRSRPGGSGWDVVLPDGTVLPRWWDADTLAYQLRVQSGQSQVDGFEHPDARTIRPGWAGERFDLHACVQALFRMTPTDTALAA